MAYTVSYLSEFLTNPSPEYIATANRVIKYLYDICFLALEYSPTGDNTKAHKAVSDVLFSNRTDRKSLAGYIVKLFNTLID
jgi:hypothetical protein